MDPVAFTNCKHLAATRKTACRVDRIVIRAQRISVRDAARLAWKRRRVPVSATPDGPPLRVRRAIHALLLRPGDRTQRTIPRGGHECIAQTHPSHPMNEPNTWRRPRWCQICGARARVVANPYYGVGLAVHSHISCCTRCDFAELLSMASERVEVDRSDAAPLPFWRRMRAGVVRAIRPGRTPRQPG